MRRPPTTIDAVGSIELTSGATSMLITPSARLGVLHVSFDFIEAFSRRCCCTYNVRRKHRFKSVLRLKVQIQLERIAFHDVAQCFATNLGFRGDHRARVGAAHRVDQKRIIAQKITRKISRFSHIS